MIEEDIVTVLQMPVWCLISRYYHWHFLIYYATILVHKDILSRIKEYRIWIFVKQMKHC